MLTFKTNGLPPPEDRFHANVIKMTGLIRRIVVEANQSGYNDVQPFIVDIAARYLDNNYDRKELIESFILSSHPPIDPSNPDKGLDHTLWDRILSKDENFFREKSFDIFKNLPAAAVSGFKTLSIYVDPKTGQPIIRKEDRDEIILYFHSFVKIGIKYIHASREPHAKQIDGEWKYFYHNSSKFGRINVLDHAKKWGIDLEFPKK